MAYQTHLITMTRKEVGSEFTRSRPFATWLATLSASFAGSLVANPLLGKPVTDMEERMMSFVPRDPLPLTKWQYPFVQILGALSSERNLMMATLVWWAVCYSPADIVYNVATNKVGQPKSNIMYILADWQQSIFIPWLESLDEIILSRRHTSPFVWSKRSTEQKRLSVE